MQPKSHVLITGGTGLVGAAITKEFLRANYRVTLLSRNPPRDARPDPNLQWIHADLGEPFEDVFTKIGNVDVVVHAAAAVHDRSDSWSLEQIANVNIVASRKIFSWCGMAGVRKVVFVSSLSVLRRPLVLPISEAHPVGPSTPYAMSKLWGEEELNRQALATGFTHVVLRVSSPIPSTFKELPCTVVRHWLEAAEQGKPLRVFGAGCRSQDFVSCSDIAAAVLRSTESPMATGVYHIGSGEVLSMLELAKLIARFRRSAIVLDGFDSNESDRWELNLDRARNDLGYIPKIPGRIAIEQLAARLL